MLNKIKIINPEFSSNITDLIMELNFLTKRRLNGTTPPLLFFQLKELFATIESIGSARIEGNNTTVVNYLQNKYSNNKLAALSFKEIQNLEECVALINGLSDTNFKIDHGFIRELHKKVVLDLKEEGSSTPGQYRKQNIKINHSKHSPPDFVQVDDYMNDLVSFINCNDEDKYKWLKVAHTHHRFTWIHPFDNGNGRLVRLITYAMLVQLNIIDKYRIINPTAIFCIDRESYYDALSSADTGSKFGVFKWYEYMLKGFIFEINKTDLLVDYRYISANIIKPTLNYSKDCLSRQEFKILSLFITKPTIKAADIMNITGNKLSASISRMILNLRKKNLIIPTQINSREYTIDLKNNYLNLGLIKSIKKCGLLMID